MVIDRTIQIRSSSCSYALERAPGGGGGGGQPGVLDGYVPDVTTQFNGEGHPPPMRYKFLRTKIYQKLIMSLT